MKINKYAYIAIVLVAFLGLIFTAQATGNWSVSGKMDKVGQPIQATGSNVEEIKGWMKIGDVATAYKVPLAEILAAFNLPPDTSPDKALKDLESDTFSVSNLRTWLSQRQAK
jgi:hypothetical protein